LASEEPVVYDRRRKAQDLAYKAMGAGSPQEVVRLCGQAILLDQRCVDALVLLNEALEEPEGRIVQLQQVIEVALEDLGGPHFLEENRGDFWGVVETRPYMRARESLASAYYQAGMVEESAAELEAMIELNPNDNQGVRYQLVGLYLELDRPEAVRRLVAEYAEDRSPMFAWSVVLERFLAGDMPGADQALAKARETNPYVEDYLLGRKVLPADTPRFYRLGDQHEAVICAYAIIRSWHLHPKAQDWLWERAVPPSVSAPVKVGRNDPCPCGSGKKYKKCCLGRDLAAEAILSNPAAAERAMLDLRRAMRRRPSSMTTISSKTELLWRILPVCRPSRCISLITARSTRRTSWSSWRCWRLSQSRQSRSCWRRLWRLSGTRD
jgi:tetratricopeptide (TPR) repeat protein